MHALDTPHQRKFSLDAPTLRNILEHAKPLGHHEDRGTLNLGFGFLYYGLVRSLRPDHIVVIGSGFGFSVTCLGLGLLDNGYGRLTFVDPSFSVFRDGPFRTVGGQSQWDDPQRVHAHFSRFGLEGVVTHYRLKSAEFFRDYASRSLPRIDLAFIDGNHSYDNVAHDFMEVLKQSRRNGYVLLHDTNIYLRELVRHAGVKRWMRRLARYPEDFEAVDFPFSSGVAIVRILREGAWQRIEPC